MVKLADAKLGTATLGSGIGDTTTDVARQSEVRDRAGEVVKSAFPTDEGTNWDALLNVLSSEFAEQYSVLANLVQQRDIDTATSAQLDKLGKRFLTERKHGESDPHYRKRVKIQWAKYTSGGTIDDIIELSTVLLDCHESELEISENPNIEPARFDVFIDEKVVNGTPLSQQDYSRLLDRIKPAGVKAEVTMSKQFTYRSRYAGDNDINDVGRAYNNAPYANLITEQYDERSLDDTATGSSWEDTTGGDAETGYGEGGYGAGGYGE